DKNMTNRQIEYAQTICSAGNDLLALINDILDLSKIEGGAMTIEIQSMALSSLKDYLVRNFDQLARSRGLSFGIELSDELPPGVRTDPKRLQQVLRNLLSNAFKFTEKGGVSVRVEPAGKSTLPESLRASGPMIAFSVIDTGIGIAAEKQAIIFEAFQQLEGGTDRRYGGTGLGLTISREIARLLGGEIQVRSVAGRGSAFTLYLPLTSHPLKPAPRQRAPETDAPSARDEARRDEDLVPLPALAEIADDRDAISPGDAVLLIIEDDATFAKLVLDAARANGFKGVVALQGASGLAAARLVRPQAALIDLRLPDTSGWMVLDALKHDPGLRHIPVLIMSGAPDEERRAMKMGAVGFIAKPATRETLHAGLSGLMGFLRRPATNLLLLESDEKKRRALLALVGGRGAEASSVKSAEEALRRLRAGRFQCAIVDAATTDAARFVGRVARVPELRRLPLLIYAGEELDRRAELRLRRAASRSIAKIVRTPEHLRDETDLFLHRSAAAAKDAPPAGDPVLAGRRVLVVDDDVRNLFSITSVLERFQMKVLSADGGRKGIETLERHPDVDVVLMDVMMPEMNGYEAMQEIRRMTRFRGLPIIAVTAKAMKGDREKCIAAGASDYLPKPVDVEQLLALLRVWLV
ncbi:MAG: response regulator, partial [Elusimicrobia bacterium]|nr:response regulator [Elusimicrobiota bacterium]